MTVKDAILNRMITQDMAHKGITCYTLTDEVAKNPAIIEVANNEAVYLYHFRAVTNNPNDPFNLSVVSPSTALQYDNENTDMNQSTRITKHLGAIRFEEALQPDYNYYISYVKIKF